MTVGFSARVTPNAAASPLAARTELIPHGTIRLLTPASLTAG
jgi:hypothetical protein